MVGVANFCIIKFAGTFLITIQLNDSFHTVDIANYKEHIRIPYEPKYFGKDLKMRPEIVLDTKNRASFFNCVVGILTLIPNVFLKT